MNYGHVMVGFVSISCGIAQFYGLDEGVLMLKKYRFPQYKICAAQLSFFNGPKSIIEVFLLLFFLSFLSVT